MPGFVGLELQSTPFHKALILHKDVNESRKKEELAYDVTLKRSMAGVVSQSLANSKSSASKRT
jgi:hypothetical protein